MELETLGGDFRFRLRVVGQVAHPTDGADVQHRSGKAKTMSVAAKAFEERVRSIVVRLPGILQGGDH